jgi:hypothetical protein
MVTSPTPPLQLHGKPDDLRLMSDRVSNLSRLALVVGLLFLAGGCSKDSSDADDFGEALARVEAAIQAPTAQWADKVAAEAGSQVHDLGGIDQQRLTSTAARESGPVQDASCKGIKKESILSSFDYLLETQRRLEDAVTRQLAIALGKLPLVLYDIKTIWPRSWLSQAGRQPDYTAPTPSTDPSYLKGYLLPRFVGDDGAFLVPAKGSADEPNFNSWMKQSGYQFPGFVGLLSRSISSAISDCTTSRSKK